jgi:hypothetical protein
VSSKVIERAGQGRMENDEQEENADNSKLKDVKEKRDERFR